MQPSSSFSSSAAASSASSAASAARRAAGMAVPSRGASSERDVLLLERVLEEVLVKCWRTTTLGPVDEVYSMDLGRA